MDNEKAFHLARGTSACAADPWSPDCQSCLQVQASDYPECASGWENESQDDPLNLRCFEQKRRFGTNFLTPIRRYVDGLTEPMFADGTLNPLFCSEFGTQADPSNPGQSILDRRQCVALLRPPGLVILTGIVGVPWQDIARDPNDLSKGYRPAEQLAWTDGDYSSQGQTPPAGLQPTASLWNVILGDTDNRPHIEVDGSLQANPSYLEIVPTGSSALGSPARGPLDPLMIESVDPREGVHPATGSPLVQPGSADPVGHPVNGSERLIPDRDDLQYACTFPLSTPLDCSDPANALGCDCIDAPENPLCWDGSGSDTHQYRGKAYPGRRQLAVLKGLGSQAVVASICPANTSDPSAADYGYRPAIAAILDKVKEGIGGSCWETSLVPHSNGTVSCQIFEASRGTTDSQGNVICEPCSGARREVRPEDRAAVEADTVTIENGLTCVCELAQAVPGSELQTCLTKLDPGSVQGWCYVDVDHGGNPALVGNCPAHANQTIRILGEGIPKDRSLLRMRCSGAHLE